MKQRSADAAPINGHIEEMMERFCTQLLAAGMKEPDWESASWHWKFYRLDTDLTAFAVNLQGRDDGVEAVYGFASLAYLRMDGKEPAETESIPLSDTQITIRQMSVIRTPEDEREAEARIREMYEAYHLCDKDALLKEKKERQKQFLNTIAVRLKPLGFKKKGAKWTKPLEKGYELTFEAQKSAFSDQYYFNIRIEKSNDSTFGSCYYTRAVPENRKITDWQLIGEVEWTAFLDDLTENKLRPLMETPLEELGKQAWLWENCHCRREKCSECWVQKNLWEAKGLDS